MVNSRAKGRSWEQQVARDLRDAMPGVDVKRGMQSGGAMHVADVECPHFFIECKVGKPNIKAALEQAMANTDGRMPVAICKFDRDKTVAAMRYEDFLSFVARMMRRENAQYQASTQRSLGLYREDPTG